MNNEPTNSQPETTPATEAPAVLDVDVEPSTSTEAPNSEDATSDVPHPVNPEPSSPASSNATVEPSLIPTPAASGGNFFSSRKRLFIGLIIAGSLAVFGSISAAAYNLWYQNPDKVLVDAFVNTVKAKSVVYTGEFNFEQKQSEQSLGETPFSKFKISVDGQQTSIDGVFNAKVEITYQGQAISLSGSVLYDKDRNIYLKINNIKKTLEAIGMTAYIAGSPYEAIITKIDGKWLKMTPSDIDEFSEGYSKKEKCINETSARLKDDNEAIGEIAKIYGENKFIIVKEKLGSKDGSLGYRVEGDQAKAKSFTKALNNTKAMKEFQKCDKDFKATEGLFDDNNSGKDKDDSKSRLEVWVDRWSHQLTSVKLSGEDSDGKGSLVVNTQFNKPVSVKAPTEDVISLSELKKDIENAFTSQYQLTDVSTQQT